MTLTKRSSGAQAPTYHARAATWRPPVDVLRAKRSTTPAHNSVVPMGLVRGRGVRGVRDRAARAKRVEALAMAPERAASLRSRAPSLAAGSEPPLRRRAEGPRGQVSLVSLAPHGRVVRQCDGCRTGPAPMDAATVFRVGTH